MFVFFFVDCLRDAQCNGRKLSRAIAAVFIINLNKICARIQSQQISWWLYDFLQKQEAKAQSMFLVESSTLFFFLFSMRYSLFLFYAFNSCRKNSHRCLFVCHTIRAILFHGCSELAKADSYFLLIEHYEHLNSSRATAMAIAIADRRKD